MESRKIAGKDRRKRSPEKVAGNHRNQGKEGKEGKEGKKCLLIPRRYTSFEQLLNKNPHLPIGLSMKANLTPFIASTTLLALLAVITLTLTLAVPLTQARTVREIDLGLDTHISISYQKKWIKIGQNPQDGLKQLLAILVKFPHGRHLVALAQSKAAQFGQTLLDVIRPGRSSLTDTTLTRRFSVENPNQVVYETHSLIYLNDDLVVIDGILDLAHELTHYVHRSPFNPYQKHFRLKDFIRSTVEGQGGEVEAYLMECQILRDIFPQKSIEQQKCQWVTNPRTGQLSKQIGIRQFYQMGNYFSKFKEEMSQYSLTSKDFPFLGSEQALFISSAYGLPYPMAALREYLHIMSGVCKNDRKRLEIYRQEKQRQGPRQNASSSNSPNSRNSPNASNASKLALYNALYQSYHSRCSEAKSLLMQ